MNILIPIEKDDTNNICLFLVTRLTSFLNELSQTISTCVKEHLKCGFKFDSISEILSILQNKILVNRNKLEYNFHLIFKLKTWHRQQTSKPSVLCFLFHHETVLKTT